MLVRPSKDVEVFVDSLVAKATTALSAPLSDDPKNSVEVIKSKEQFSLFYGAPEAVEVTAWVAAITKAAVFVGAMVVATVVKGRVIEYSLPLDATVGTVSDLGVRQLAAVRASFIES
jgi:hypothetical protein